MFLYMAGHFVLSQPLNITEPIKVFRREEDLAPFKYNKIKNIILDLDEINTKDNYLETIEYFRENNYSCILGKSRSWNGKDIFNMKGILRVEFENDFDIIKTALTQIQLDLGARCKVDLTVSQTQSYQAPSRSKQVVYYNEKGKKFTDKNVHIENVKSSMGTDYKIELSYDNEVIDECISIFSSLGYTPIKGSMNHNGSINFQHPCEVKSKGGFFWYSTQPLVMNHPNTARTISIFNLLKDTEVGKKWLKNKTKDEQKYQLIKDNYTRYLDYRSYNERYLDFTDDTKIEIIDNFLDSKSDVLKIKSAMGTAKSNGIDLCIKKAHIKKLKVLLISNRVSVAKDFTEKYNMMWYKDEEAWKQEKSLVVQFDSLHRFDIDKFDVVILDEYISLLFHHRTNLTNNSNINIVKFKIFMERKRVLIADAFLTGFEDIFFENRNILMIDNNYRDTINIMEYTNKEYFIKTIIKAAQELTNGKKISASFTSNNIMKVVHLELRRLGIKVIMLNAETPDHTRSLIYDRFKEAEHNAYDVILYSPTLTVGVSNLNNIDDHFHYDSGMSTDVVSSLQMIKRSRKAKNIHFFLEERQFYFDTDVASINSVAETNINNFYNNKDSTLLIDINYETGKLKLTELGRYVNKIEAFYNITKNNHANAFKLLLEHQFEGSKEDIEVIDIEDNSFNIREIIKEIKNKETKDKLKILDDWENKDFSAIDIDRLRTKTIELSPEEKMELVISEINIKFKGKLEPSELIEIGKLQIESNFKYLGMVSRLRTTRKAFASRDYAKYLLSQAISGDISSLQNKTWINFLEYISLLSGTTKLRKTYSENDIKTMDNHYLKGKKFKNFIKSIGYIKKKGDARYRQDETIFKFSKKI